MKLAGELGEDADFLLALAGFYTDMAMSGAEEDRPGLWEAVAALGREVDKPLGIA